MLSYSNNKLYIDENGTLVAVRNARVRGPYPRLFQQRSDGSIWITPQRSNGTVSQTTQIGQIGEPFIMPLCLQPTSHKNTKPPKNTATNVTRCHATGDTNQNRIKAWHDSPKECYLALADALYRPRVIMNSHNFTRSGQILCDIDLPYFIPGKSKLIVEVDESITRYGQAAPAQTYDPQKRPLAEEEISNLKIGPNRYRIERVVIKNSSRTLKVRARLNLYGNDEILLPYEDKFDGSDIETEAGEENKPAIKWICTSKTMSLL